jgi:hypothetical protein
MFSFYFYYFSFANVRLVIGIWVPKLAHNKN